MENLKGFKSYSIYCVEKQEIEIDFVQGQNKISAFIPIQSI